MRFLQKEFNDISKIIDRYGLKDQYVLVKRKGWVFVEIKGKSFGFHRKEASSLVNGKLVHNKQYSVRIEKTELLAKSFTQVLEHLEKWLDKIEHER